MRIIGTAAELRWSAQRRIARGAVVAVGGLLLLLAWLVVHSLPAVRESVVWILGIAGIGATAWGVRSVRRGLALADLPPACGRVVHDLAAALGNESILLRHVTLPHGGGIADAILFGPYGALVLSLNALHGTFVHDEHHWYRVGANGVPQLWDRSPTWEVTRPWKSVRRFIRQYGYNRIPVHAAVVLASGSLATTTAPATTVSPSQTAPPGPPPAENGLGHGAAAPHSPVAAAQEEAAPGSQPAADAAEPESQRSRWRRGGRSAPEHPVFPVISGPAVVSFVEGLPAAGRVTPDVVDRLADALRHHVG